MTRRRRPTIPKGGAISPMWSGAICAIVALAICVPPALGDDAPPTSPPQPTTGSPPPSLDDLLGLERDADDGAAEAARRRQEALRRRLTEQEKRDAFVAAVDDMRRVGELLGETGDAGIGTQRLQEEILERLEALLRQPPRRDSGSPSGAPDDQAQQEPQQAPAQPTAGQGTASGAAEDAAEDSAPGDVPPADATLLEQALEESGVEWGNLPDRVRDMIRQGLRERPSSLYERLTEAYYRRLAEESSR